MANGKKPNILVIFGDDMRFTDAYAEQSCTADQAMDKLNAALSGAGH